MSYLDGITTRCPIWYEICDCDGMTVSEDINKDYAPSFKKYQFSSPMTHIPHGNNVEWIQKIGPLPYGMCYDLDCDDFFDRNGNFNFEAWKKDDEAPWFFQCRSFSSTSLHKCGYTMFSEILQDGLEFYLNGTEPPENGGRTEPRFTASLGSIKINFSKKEN